MADGPILVLGGSGFVGRHVVEAARRERRTRRRADAQARQGAASAACCPRSTSSTADVDVAGDARRGSRERASAVVNLVGILNETAAQHVPDGARRASRARVIAACNAAGVRRLVHMSALNADPAGPSRYLRSKGEAEAIVAASGLDWTIFRPSVIFGREDAFLNLFAKLAALRAGHGARAAPTRGSSRSTSATSPHASSARSRCRRRSGRRYPLCGPSVYTLRELVRYVGERDRQAAPDRRARSDARHDSRRSCSSICPERC